MKYIIYIIDDLSPGGYLPPNSWTGMGAMERMLPKEFQYELLPEDSNIRTLCDTESFYIADRPIDWRNKNYSANFKYNLVDLINDRNPRCLKLVGYFQNLPLCKIILLSHFSIGYYNDILSYPYTVYDILVYRC